MSRIDVEAVVLRIARTQDGVVARWQLHAAGMPMPLLDDRVKRRRLQRIARGVYVVPGLEGPHARVLASVLGAGPDAVASHETAGHLQQLVGHPGMSAHVSTSRGNPRRREGIVYHRVRLAGDERTVCDGVPVTSPSRTLLDLAPTLPDRSLEQAVARALRHLGVTTEGLIQHLTRYPGRPGTRRLRALLDADTAPSFTRSEAEERFLQLVRAAQLPAPDVNLLLHGYEVDFCWAHHGVVVEIDGLAYHTTRDAQLRDRRRDTSLAAAGIRVLRFTWQDLTRAREATLAKVALALGRGMA